LCGALLALSLSLFLPLSSTQRFEDTITQIQIAVQQATTSEYQQQVVHVLKQIDIMDSKANATCAVVNARAMAPARVLVNKANAFALNVTHEAKALAYSRLQQTLKLTAQDMVKYVRIKTIQTHAGSRMTVSQASPVDHRRN
jgi:hypothetical protein